MLNAGWLRDLAPLSPGFHRGRRDGHNAGQGGTGGGGGPRGYEKGVQRCEHLGNRPLLETLFAVLSTVSTSIGAVAPARCDCHSHSAQQGWTWGHPLLFTRLCQAVCGNCSPAVLPDNPLARSRWRAEGAKGIHHSTFYNADGAKGVQRGTPLTHTTYNALM